MKCCDQCGRTNKDTDTVCVGCGASLPDEPNIVISKPADNRSHEPAKVEYTQAQTQNSPADDNQAADQALQAQKADSYFSAPEFIAENKTDFVALEQNKDIVGLITAAGIICYIAAALTLIFAVIIAGNPFSLIDVGILLICGIGIHAAQSRVCAIILTVYSLVSMILTIINGSFGGWLVVLAGIFAIVATFKFHSRWAAYCLEHKIEKKKPASDGNKAE